MIDNTDSSKTKLRKYPSIRLSKRAHTKAKGE